VRDRCCCRFVCNSFQLCIQINLVHFWCHIRCRPPCISSGHTSDLELFLCATDTAGPIRCSLYMRFWKL
jgi:hypothetical protein